MDPEIRKKYINAILIIAISNALAGGLFIFAFFLSQNTIYLWGGVAVLFLTLLALVFVFVKILKIKQ